MEPSGEGSWGGYRFFPPAVRSTIPGRQGQKRVSDAFGLGKISKVPALVAISAAWSRRKPMPGKEIPSRLFCAMHRVSYKWFTCKAAQIPARTQLSVWLCRANWFLGVLGRAPDWCSRASLAPLLLDQLGRVPRMSHAATACAVRTAAKRLINLSCALA